MHYLNLKIILKCNITKNDVEQSSSGLNTHHPAESSFENVMRETSKPLNKFQQQLLSTTGRYTIHE